MGMLTFSNDPPKVYEIPRLEDHLIDELFYQEDEIGEMRHAAFMIECGLEEDPPDGPDVPPIPWDAKSAALYATPATQSRCETTATTKREPPKRTSSMDDIDELEGSSPSHREPRRKLTVTKSGTLHGMRAPLTEKSHSSDSIEDLKDDPSSRRRAAPVVRQPKKLVKAKSGSLHGMRDVAKKVQEANDRKAAVAAAATAAAQEQQASPHLTRNKLVATKSGTLHGMRKAVEELNSKDSPVKASPVVRRKLVVTKSGTLHGMRRPSEEQPAVSTKDASPVMPKRNVVPTGRDYTTSLNRGSPTKPSYSQKEKPKRPERKVSNSSGSDEDSLDRFDNSNSDPESDVSLDTDEDVPKSPRKKKDELPKIPFHSQSRTPIRKPIVVDEGNEKREDSKPRNRVFRNGKLVTDDGATPDKSSGSTSTTTSVVSSVREKIVNGNAVAHILKSAQLPRTSLTKTNPSPVGVPPAFQNNAGVPSLFQSAQKPSSSDKARPGKVKIPLKVKSLGAVDVPPAFRASGVGK